MANQRTLVLQKKGDKKIVKDSLNADVFPKDYEINVLPSVTIPDMSMSVREIMERHARGLPQTGVKVPVYDQLFDDDDFSPIVDPSKLDLAERQELKEQFEQELKEFEYKFAAREKAKAEEEKQQKEQQQNPNSFAKTPPEAKQNEHAQHAKSGSEADGKKA